MVKTGGMATAAAKFPLFPGAISRPPCFSDHIAGSRIDNREIIFGHRISVRAGNNIAILVNKARLPAEPADHETHIVPGVPFGRCEFDIMRIIWQTPIDRDHNITVSVSSVLFGLGKMAISTSSR